MTLPLSKSIAGTAILVSPANTQEVVHELAGAFDRDTVKLTLINTHTGTVMVKVHYNGQAPQFEIPAGKVEHLEFTIAGTAHDGTVITNKKVSVECDADAVLYVMGGAAG